jgi:CheY-like chemotaxis protein
MPRILVVDDDVSVRAATRTLLEREGYEVVCADTRRTGIEAIATTPFNAVIVDIFMPDMDGLQTIKAFNRRAPGVPIIAMSGFMFRDSSAPAPDFLSMSTKLGAAYSVRKPFRPLDLLRALEACLGGEHGSALSRGESQSTIGGG